MPEVGGLALDEDRAEHEQVVRVDASAEAVVHREHVPWLHGRERVVLDHGGQRAAQARRVHQVRRGRQRDQPSIAIEDRGTGIRALDDHCRVRGLYDDDAGLFSGDAQGMAQNLGVERGRDGGAH